MANISFSSPDRHRLEGSPIASSELTNSGAFCETNAMMNSTPTCGSVSVLRKLYKYDIARLGQPKETP